MFLLRRHPSELSRPAKGHRLPGIVLGSEFSRPESQSGEIGALEETENSVGGQRG